MMYCQVLLSIQYSGECRELGCRASVTVWFSGCAQNSPGEVERNGGNNASEGYCASAMSARASNWGAKKANSTYCTRLHLSTELCA
jgi:hypothetical protein